MKKAVVTGGAGFIGHNLVRALVERGFDAHIVDRDPSFRRDILHTAAKLHEIDTRSTTELQEVFEGADTVFHMAAVPRVPYSIEHPVETTDENITGTVSVLTAAARAKVRRVVNSSSGSAYGDQTTMPFVETMMAQPMHPYGLQKYVGERFAELWPTLYGVETVSLRYFNVYGSGMDPNGAYALAIAKFADAQKKGEPLTIFGDGSVTRDFTHVSDVVEANILASESKKVGRGEVINVGAGRNVTIQVLAEMFDCPITYGPARVEGHDALAGIERAKELLGWVPKVQLEDGIAALKKEMGIA